MAAPRNRTFWGGAAIVLATALAYGNSLRGPFVFLDVSAIRDNPTIRRLWPLWEVLHPAAGRGATVQGRPILNLSFALNYAVSGDRVWSYHVLNLGIHILAALALYGIVRRTLRSEGVALATALLWALHPLQTESVTYMVQRAESLMGLFYLLALYGFIRAAAGGSRGWYAVSWLAALAGVGTKEVAVSVPVIIFLYDRAFVSGSLAAAWRARRGYYLALAATWIPLAWLVAGTGGNRGGTTGLELGVSWWSYALTQFPAIAHYLRLAVWPHPLVFYYAVTWVTAAQAAPWAVLVLGLAAASAVALWRWPRWGVAPTWFFAILAPTSLIPGISQTMAEHRMYLALAPVIGVLVVAGRAVLVRWRAPRWVGPGLVLGAAVGCAGLTASRNRVYGSEVALWTDTVGKVPTSPYTQNDFGVALAAAGRGPEAIEHFEAALRLNPRYAEACDNLGLALAGAGRLPEAIRSYERALTLRPDYAQASANLGVALTDAGRLPEAVARLERAVELDPENAAIRNNLAVALATSGRLPEAIEQYGKVLRLGLETAEVHDNLADALAETGRWTEAIPHYERALALRPADPEAQANLGAALAGAGRLAEAVAQYRRALAQTPGDADIHYNLALALRALGREDEARAEFAEAARWRSAEGAPAR